MRATPSFRRLARTMTRPASSSVMCEASTAFPSAMPTRSAPSSSALRLTSSAVIFFLLISILALLEFLQLLRDHALVAFLADPAHVPLRQPGHVRARLAVALVFLVQRDLLRGLLRDVLLDLREMRVIVVADRADREAARAVAEGADDAQQSLPEAEQVDGLQQAGFFRSRRIDDPVHELQHGHEAEFLRLGGAGALVDAPVQHRVRRARVQAAAARFADADLLGDALVGLELVLGEDAREIHARAELRREDVHFEAERAEARFDAEVARREPAVGSALIAPVGFLRRGDEGRMAQA